MGSNVTFSLSPSQQRVWFLHQLDAHCATFNIPVAFKIDGRLHVGELRNALEYLTRRHGALRTRFREEGGLPVQYVCSSVELSFELFEASDGSTERHLSAQFLRVLEDRAWKPFDLSRECPFRVHLFRLHKETFVLLIVVHHIVADGWSMDILLRDLSKLYRDRQAGLEPISLGLGDYQQAVERNSPSPSALEAQALAYWKKQLDGALGFDFVFKSLPRRSSGHEGRSLAKAVPKRLQARINDFASNTSSTVFTVLLAAFKLLLFRLTGKSDIIVGCPIAGREFVDDSEVIGCFLEVFPIRTKLPDNPTFTDLVRRVRDVIWDCLDHRHVSFEKLVAETAPGRGAASGSPLFTVLVNKSNFVPGELNLGEISAKPINFRDVRTKCDLTLYIGDTEDGLFLTIMYRRELFDETEANSFVEQYLSVLSQCTKTPEKRLADFSLVTRAARAHLPKPNICLDAGWRGSVSGRVRMHAAKHPFAAAIESQRNLYSYFELDQLSSGLCARLQNFEVQPSEAVAIFAARTPELIIAILGTLRAGAAFAIVDPALPFQYVRRYLHEIRPAALIVLSSAGKLTPEIAEYIDCTGVRGTILLQSAKGDLVTHLAPLASTARECRVRADGLACLTATSGTTASPSIVVGVHGSLTHFLPDAVRDFQLTASDRFSMLSGLSHDPLQRDIFTALWVGGTICVPEPEVYNCGLLRWICNSRITVLNLTPSLVKVASVAGGMRSDSIRYVFSIGEPLLRADAESLLRTMPHARIINLYGTTETQRALTQHELDLDGISMAGQSLTQSGSVPIGSQAGAVQLLILNDRRKLAGPGEVGSIVIRSPHLARGYLNDTERTHERFLPDPHDCSGVTRLFVTGDIGRYRCDGSVEYLGRADRQVKMKGSRIELSHLETVLRNHVDVKDAFVTTSHGPCGAARLIAYVATSAEGADLPSRLRRYCRSELPSYAIPAQFIVLENLPRTVNFKLDTHALATRQFTEIDASERHPSSPVEIELHRIWSTLLGKEGIGVQDDFFELGGDSFLALQLASSIRDRFGVDLSLALFFQFPTIERCSEAIVCEKVRSLVSVKTSTYL